MSKRVLVVVDMQNDFVTGALGSKEAQDIVPKVVKKIKQAREDNVPVIFTQDTHDERYLSIQEGKLLPVQHCIVGTRGWELIPEIKELVPNRSSVIEKSGFGAEPSYLEEVLYENDAETADEYEVCGLCTDICVISNVVLLKTLYRESKITVDAQAVAGVTPEKNAAALEVMKSIQVNVINEPPTYVGKRIQNNQ